MVHSGFKSFPADTQKPVVKTALTGALSRTFVTDRNRCWKTRKCVFLVFFFFLDIFFFTPLRRDERINYATLKLLESFSPFEIFYIFNVAFEKKNLRDVTISRAMTRPIIIVIIITVIRGIFFLSVKSYVQMPTIHMNLRLEIFFCNFLSTRSRMIWIPFDSFNFLAEEVRTIK